MTCANLAGLVCVFLYVTQHDITLWSVPLAVGRPASGVLINVCNVVVVSVSSRLVSS